MNYIKIYNCLISKRKENTPVGYCELHHILPRCLGGDDSKSNLVKLTAKEHFIAHLLLTKIYPKDSIEYIKMIHAFFRMRTASISHNNERIYSRMFERLRLDFVRCRSLLTAGESNNQFGKKWVHNAELKQSKRIDKGDPIQDGWVNGRVIDWDKYLNREQQKFIVQQDNELYFNSQKIKYTKLHEIYCIGGFEAVVNFGYKHSHPCLVNRFKKYVDEFKPQSRIKRGIK